MNKNKFVLAALAVLTITAQADQKSNTSSEYTKCYDKVDLGAMKNSQWAACDEAELQRLDKKLNQIYSKLRGSLDASQKAQMTKGQKAWLDYRESWCRFNEVAQLTAPMGSAAYTSCVVQMTDEKINELHDLANAAGLK